MTCLKWDVSGISNLVHFRVSKYNATRLNKFVPKTRQLVIKYLYVRYSIRQQQRMVLVCPDPSGFACSFWWLKKRVKKKTKKKLEADKKEMQ